MHAVMWDGNTDQPGFADVANAVDAGMVAQALVAFGVKGVAYWHIDGRSATSAEVDVSLLSLPQLEAKFVR